ncbi:MAG: putative lipoprotein [Fibrobacteres bacterium]|nr:putative lipoprotein [Fibrobacterota bacterium]
MESRIRNNGMWLSALGVCGALFAGCLFEGGEKTGPAGPSPIPSMRCADLSPSQQKAGDSLVALAQKLQASDVEMMVSSRQPQWNEVGDGRVRASMAYYNQALAAAPGHCGALFGRALAQSQLLLQDKGLNAVVSQALPGSGAGAMAKRAGGSSLPVAQAFKAPRDEAAPMLLRIASGLSRVDKPFISAQQERFATEVLPTLDSVIASLDAVLAKGDFSITYPKADGGFIEIDAGEVGPVLGGLKVARAVVLLLSGYQWEIARENSYDWIDRVGNLRPADFRRLTATQRADLDHLTGFFRPGNAFTRVKPEWKASIQGIPDLLLQAVDNTITGLKYSLAEAGHPEKQINDVYRVGTGEGDDIDPKELEGVIDALDRTRKYLKGEVNLSYNNGTHTLKLNFPKVFAWDGLQNFLPYYTQAPYETWFAPLADPGEVEVESGLENGDPAAKVLEALGLSSSDAVRIRPDGAGYQVMLEDNTDEWFGNTYRGPAVLLADLTPGAAPCTFEFAKHAGRRRAEPTPFFPDENTFVSTAEESTGLIALGNACRVTAAGQEYLTTRYSGEAVPFWFTDASGKKTLEPAQLGQIVNDLGLAALTGKVVFRDPTFGGAFPELNNDNIWSTIQSLDKVGPRLNEKCGPDGQECTHELPDNPSDLDVWAHYLFWLDNLF